MSSQVEPTPKPLVDADVKVKVKSLDAFLVEEEAIIKENMLPEKDRMQIVFRNLTYNIKISKPDPNAKFPKKNVRADKTILKGVTGLFQPGRLIAVMGASGAGKTSLLQIIAAEAHLGSLTGSITINGEEVGTQGIKKISGFVFQDDIILATMTVKEAITMSALLRLPADMSVEEKNDRVTKIIKLLNLEKAADTIIGDSQTKGISGGERKRTAMAMEMITNPSVLFLDEPTSGLDTFTAYSVVRTLKNLAATGRTIIATIHQPSSEVFHLFDDLLLMAEGRTIYSGPAEDAIEYFARLGYECPEYTNPADFLFMSVLNNEDPSASPGAAPQVTQAERITGLLNSWDNSIEANNIDSLTRNPRTGGIEGAAQKIRSLFTTQFAYLFKRASKNAFRNPLVVQAKLGQSVVIALIIGILYYGTGTDYGYSGAQNRQGMLFFTAVNMVMSSTIGVLSIFGEEKVVFTREYGAGYYGLPAYFFSKILVEMPFQIIFPWIFATIVYWFVGLQNVGVKYLVYVLFSVLSSCCGFSLGIAIACIFESLETALAAAPLMLMPLMLFSGLFVNNGSIPVYFDWIKYISPMKYAFEGLYKNELTGLQIVCNSTSRVPERVDGSVCIQNQGFNDSFSILLCVIILLIMVLVLIIVAYASLLRVVLAKGKAVTPSKAKATA
ncbi:ABC-2 type transporter-domain-containing protein [Chytridium lagenaria]|nr:ABC-2 type transporter-domain-containing protein [Chytridium lagenaria]